MQRRLLFLLLVALAMMLPSRAGAAGPAEQLRPIDLRVSGGADAWHADNDFRLDWDRPPVAEHGFPISAVNYRVRAGSAVIATVRVPREISSIDHIEVPNSPGVYSVDVWLEGPDGAPGPIQSTTLRFDNARPGSAQPLVPVDWVAGDEPVRVRIEAPVGAAPLSGIRGYAVSVDRGAPSQPCAAADRCSPSETNLPGNLETLSLGPLPEGVNVVRAVAVSGSGMRSAETRTASVHVDATPPTVTLRGVPRGWANGPLSLSASASDALSGMGLAGPAGAYTAIAVDGALPKIEYGDLVTATVSGEGVHSVAFYARDGAGNVDQDSPSLAVIRIDETPPRLAFAASQDPSEPERIEAVVTDSLSGTDPTRGSIAVRPLNSRGSFQSLPTTVSAGRLVAHWDSDSFPPGTYEFRATGFDQAGNVAASERRANGVRFILANPLKTPTALAAGFGGKRLVWQRCTRGGGRRHCRQETIESFEARPTTRTVPYGRGVAYAGRLSSRPGASIGGLPVQIIETFAGGHSSPRTTTVRTASDGTFLARLAPGPSRQVEALFPGTRTLSRASGGLVRLQVLAGVRLRASSAVARIGAAPVVFSGRVGDLGAPIPNGGRPVELQFRLSGGEWSEFRTVQTDRHGRFRFPYSFSDDDSRGVRFQFRAFAPAEDGWPYEPAASRPVFVTGR